MDKDKRITDKIWQLCFKDLGRSVAYHSRITDTDVRRKYNRKWTGITPEPSLRVKLLDEGCGK
jgi:hypothetical protein